MNTVLRRAGAATAAAAAILLSIATTSVASPSAPPPQLAPAASADAYGLDVDATLTSLDIEVDEGPFGRATQDYPPLATGGPASDEVLGAGPFPASGQLVKDISVIGGTAEATAAPKATARGYAEGIELIDLGSGPMLTIESLVATSTTDCLTDPTGGTVVVGLSVNGITEEITAPSENFELAAPIFNPLGLRVILNEHHKTADGRGLVVNALHIYNTTGGLVPGLFTGDIIIGHAMSTVNCPNGAPSTGDQNPIFITKDADKATARAGDTVTYTATVQNKSTTACAVNQFIDHLPVAFDLVSTSGAFGTVGETVARPGGGTDVVIKPTGLSIPAGGSATQTFVLKVRDDAVPAVYFNNVEILCANLGNWVKGLDAPVEVVDETPPTTPPPTKPPADLPECSDKVDNDGDGLIDYPKDPGCPTPIDDNERDDTHPRTGSDRTALWAAGILLVAGAFGIRRLALR